ncbi:hypothetical protein HDU97_009747 [Phlyctochytrium planicorne]|nr:hypothetical protein HDU97_009747 [Phlyctochytrium planicorne]
MAGTSSQAGYSEKQMPIPQLSFYFVLALASLVASQGSDHDPPSFSDAISSYCGASKSCGSILQSGMGADLAFTKGLPAVFFMQFIASNKTTQVGNTTSIVGMDILKTASFYPFVDEYSELVVPNSFSLLTQWSLSTINVPRLQMILFFRGQLFKTGLVTWTKFSDGGLYYVPARTVKITLKNGELKDEIESNPFCLATTINSST